MELTLDPEGVGFVSWPAIGVIQDRDVIRRPENTNRHAYADGPVTRGTGVDHTTPHFRAFRSLDGDPVARCPAIRVSLKLKFNLPVARRK